jgi:DNA-binding response OmpR family regulator
VRMPTVWSNVLLLMESSQPVAADRRDYSAKLRILVVDDDRDTVETLTFILRDEGYVVSPVYTGDEALKVARLFRPDVIISDIAIPGMSGYAVAQSLLYGFTDLRRPLMIAISGVWKQLPDRKVAEQMGFDEYLTKPCDTAALLRLIESFKRSRHAPPRPST